MGALMDLLRRADIPHQSPIIACCADRCAHFEKGCTVYLGVLIYMEWRSAGCCEPIFNACGGAFSGPREAITAAEGNSVQRCVEPQLSSFRRRRAGGDIYRTVCL
jgi:hypothetical protein